MGIFDDWDKKKKIPKKRSLVVRKEPRVKKRQSLVPYKPIVVEGEWTQLHFDKRKGKRRSTFAKNLRRRTRGSDTVFIFGEKQLGMTGKQRVAVKKARAKLKKGVKRTARSIWRHLV